jgi:hypothetical protein
MRISKYIVVAVTGAMLAMGCQKNLLNTVPNDRISTDIFWKTDNDATLAANAIYTYMAETPDHFMGWDNMSDILFTNPTGPVEAAIKQGQYDGLNTRIAADWTTYYAGIRGANTFMAHVDAVQTTNAALISRLKGEVRAMRAYFYMKLASLWGDVPLITNEITVAESEKLQRTNVQEVWDFVATELDTAATLLPVKQTDLGRITKGAALAIKARAMLYAGRYDAAATAAQAVMSSGTYKLYPSYKNLFSYAAENSSEDILDVQFLADVYPSNMFQVLAPRSVNANSKWVPTKAIVDAYEMKNGLMITDPGSGYDPANQYANRDPRLSYSIFVPKDTLPNGKIFNSLPSSTTGDAVGSSFVVSPTGWNVKKYVNKEDLSKPADGGINIMLIRYAEVLLTYAESMIEQNKLDQSVYDAINTVRQRPDVNMPPLSTGLTQDQLRQAVRLEREVELAFEGMRYMDIRRWKIAENVMPGNVYGLTYKDTDGSLKTVVVPGWNQTFSDKLYLWPVPQKELDLNKNLGQNPGW